ncbi:efflux RND transporter permease subunit, partial [Brachyspira catarrhinii]|uniref:efflux RND transporter permease subunit n=1 Tax=Brachyspira catarrhinii TaxID=2528966 RepID=UPI001F02EE31
FQFFIPEENIIPSENDWNQTLEYSINSEINSVPFLESVQGQMAYQLKLRAEYGMTIIKNNSMPDLSIVGNVSLSGLDDSGYFNSFASMTNLNYFVGLAGVVVNNGIIMVDLINRILESGNIKNKDDVFNAIVEGASERFRAIFLTTITTIFGLLPTVYGIGGRADLIVPIVMAMAYGLLFASLLTLILLPCLFMVSADLKLVRINYKD